MKIKGFTLLETLIYIALFGVLMSGALVTVYELLISSERTSSSVATITEGEFINRKLSWALSGAYAVSVPNAYTLIITRSDLGFESPLQFSMHDGGMYLKRGTQEETRLTGDAFSIADVSIETVPSQDNLPMLVRITYTVNLMPFIYETYLRL